MKNKFFALLAIAGASWMLAGCVETVDGGKRAGMPWLPDQMQGLYERSSDQVYDASKAVLVLKGVLTAEKIIHTPAMSGTNEVAGAGAIVYRSLEAKVDQCFVYVRVREVDPAKPLTELTVQVRTKAGANQIGLSHEIEKEIALRLAAAR